MARLKTPARVVIVDPVHRRLIPAQLKPTEQALRRMLKAPTGAELGQQKVLSRMDVDIFAFGLMDTPEGTPGFSFRGFTVESAGTGVLFRRNPNGGMAREFPVDIAWLRREVVWIDECRPTSAEQDAGA